MFKFISTVELPYLHNELLNVTVDEKQESREEDEQNLLVLSNLSEKDPQP